MGTDFGLTQDDDLAWRLTIRSADGSETTHTWRQPPREPRREDLYEWLRSLPDVDDDTAARGARDAFPD